MSWKERLLRSLPLIAGLAGTYSFVVTDEQWSLIIMLVAVWLMDSPIPGTIAVARALKGRPNVSRETVIDPNESVAEYIVRTTPNVSRETISAPCVVMHGSAEPHVEGCEGWSLGRG